MPMLRVLRSLRHIIANNIRIPTIEIRGSTDMMKPQIAGAVATISTKIVVTCVVAPVVATEAADETSSEGGLETVTGSEIEVTTGVHPVDDGVGQDPGVHREVNFQVAEMSSPTVLHRDLPLPLQLLWSRNQEPAIVDPRQARLLLGRTNSDVTSDRNHRRLTLRHRLTINLTYITFKALLTQCSYQALLRLRNLYPL